MPQKSTPSSPRTNPAPGVNGNEVQSNLTDPESRKIHTSKGTVPGYDFQALVAESQPA